MTRTLVLLFAIAVTVAACSTPNATSTGVRRMDSLHGLGYPYTFERARELRKANLFSPAAYIYIYLFPENQDSVLREVWRMNGEAFLLDSTKLAPYYLTQSLMVEALADNDIVEQGPIKPGGSTMNRAELARRSRIVSEMIDQLRRAYGLE